MKVNESHLLQIVIAPDKDDKTLGINCEMCGTLQTVRAPKGYRPPLDAPWICYECTDRMIAHAKTQEEPNSDTGVRTPMRVPLASAD